MKKMLALLLVPCMLLGSLLLFSGCAKRVTYDNSDAYTAGGFESDAEIHSVEIYWEGKYVSVSGSYSNKIKAEEDHEEADKKALHYLIEDGVLKIYPCDSGKRVADLEKSLFLELPMNIANNLQKLEIRAMGDTTVYLQMLKPTMLDVTTENGNVNVDVNNALDLVRVQTERGNLTAKCVSVCDFEFISKVGKANLSMHLYGFTAVMRNEKGSFSSPDYEVSQNGSIYTYGTQEPALIFDTEGAVVLKDNPILK